MDREKLDNGVGRSRSIMSSGGKEEEIDAGYPRCGGRWERLMLKVHLLRRRRCRIGRLLAEMRPLWLLYM